MENTLMTTWSNLGGHLQSFIGNKIKDKEAAKDLVQDVFIKVKLKLHTLNDTEKINSWIFQITRNTINDYFRNQKKAYQSLPADEWETTSFSKDETLELSRCMLPMIDLLPDKYKEALMLSDIEGMPQKELAERLGISYSGAKSRVQRGREKLKEVFLQCCEINTDKYGNVIEFQKKNCSLDCGK